MSKSPAIKLYIAQSLDGFIARENGELDWLMNLPNPNQLDYGYGEFLEGIDTILMGRQTYEEILGFGVDWPYSDSETYVLSRQRDYQTKTAKTQAVELTSFSLEKIKAQSKKSIWIVGGGQIITELLNWDEIDEIILTIIPIILGNGIPLFPNSPKETSLDLIKTQSFETGAVSLTYRRKPTKP
ncbi:dihydrofolate reductase family protein [Algoriphagus namhaensis]|uniref:Dihydrofolate reductase family protein n=1 Tax=Algoriphagus namhaensis TaxID=915353 RepID=A0ABV8AU70_9BACT